MSWLLLLAGAYAMVLAVITVFNWTGADRYWFGALNFYLPQIMWAIPGVVLTVLLFRVERFWVWVPLLCLAWVLGPVMGFRWSVPTSGSARDLVKLRVMTWNVKYGSYDLAPLVGEINRVAPDVVFFQDAIAALNGPLGKYFENWQVISHGQFVIASRYPLSGAEVHELAATGEGQEYLRCQMRIGPETVTLYNVHLRTPRKGLNEFRNARKQPWYLPEAIQIFDHNVNTRLVEAAQVAAGLRREKGAVILAGDLNSPDTSQVCGTLREAGLHDAFDERGVGYGFTYGHFLFKHRLPWLKISWMRIDHIMMDARFRTERCWAGTGQASDHRPVIADLVLRSP